MEEKQEGAKEDWSDEQRRLLVECAMHATVVTGHEIHDCIMELRSIVRAYKDGNADEQGKKK